MNFFRYGKGFGIMGRIFGEKSVMNQPNGIFGIIFYSQMVFLCKYKINDNINSNLHQFFLSAFISCSHITRVQIALSGLSILLSCYLAYLLYFVLEDFCVVCVSTYVVNFSSFYFACQRYKQLRGFESSSSAVPTKKSD